MNERVAVKRRQFSPSFCHPRESCVNDNDNILDPDWPLLCKLHEIWSVDSREHHSNCCHQMSHFKAEMHQIRFRLGSAPDPAARWGSLQRSPDPLAGFKGPYF